MATHTVELEVSVPRWRIVLASWVIRCAGVACRICPTLTRSVVTRVARFVVGGVRIRQA